jgi:hypothetical protein
LLKSTTNKSQGLVFASKPQVFRQRAAGPEQFEPIKQTHKTLDW